MIQAQLDGLKLANFAKIGHLPPHATDNGYLVHMALMELFGDHTPKPFVITKSRGRELEILGYSSQSATELKQHADTFASPEKHQLCDWSRFASKPMPTKWPQGKDLGFELKTCPVKRMAKGGKHHKKGAEVDVFLAKCWEVDDPSVPVDRYETYRHWLAETFARAAGAELVSDALEVSAFRKARLVRKTQRSQKAQSDGSGRRKAIVFDKPEATFRGRLTLKDPERFQQMLSKGIGRHKAFGYGMLLLKP